MKVRDAVPLAMPSDAVQNGGMMPPAQPASNLRIRKVRALGEYPIHGLLTRPSVLTAAALAYNILCCDAVFFGSLSDNVSG